MVARNATLFKWALYSAAIVLCLLVQRVLLQRIALWGVIPFVYPLLAAIPATFEDSVTGTAFALLSGVLSDLLLPAPLPCFYTLVFPFVGLLAASLSRSVLRSGFLCSAVSGALAFFLTDGFSFLLFWVLGRGDGSTAGMLFLREMLVSLPLIFPLTVLFRAVSRRVHRDD